MKACLFLFAIALPWPVFSMPSEDTAVVKATVNDEEIHVWTDTTNADVRVELTITTRQRSAGGSDCPRENCLENELYYDCCYLCRKCRCYSARFFSMETN